MIEEGIEALKRFVRMERGVRKSPKLPEWNFAAGCRWGAFNVLCAMGYEDAAQEAVRSVMEDERAGRS